MKQKRKVSVLIALMMLLTVLAVPSMAFGASYSYKIVPAGQDKMPDYVPIGGKVDLNVVSSPAGANVDQSDWTWEVQKSDFYSKENTSAIATIDQNGVLTAKGEGKVSVVAMNPAAGSGYYDDEDDWHSNSLQINLNVGFIEEYSGVRIYPDGHAKLMSGYAYNDDGDIDLETYAVPTQVIIEKPDAKHEAELSEVEKAWYNNYARTYPVTAIREDAISSDTIKNFIVPDAVKSIGSHAMGYEKINHSSGDPAKATYLKTNSVTIYGQSNNPAAAKYAKANGFTYKNMNTGKTVTITVTPNKPKKVIKKLKSGKKYYVKVRAYKKSGNKKIYGAYSKVKTVKVK